MSTPRQTRWSQDRKEQKLCVSCGQPRRTFTSLCDGWEYAFWRYLGKHPDKLIPFFVERAEKHRLMEELCATPADLLAVRPTCSADAVATVPRLNASLNAQLADSLKNTASATMLTSSTTTTIPPKPSLLYQTAAQELAIPPKKPVSKVASPRKHKEKA